MVAVALGRLWWIDIMTRRGYWAAWQGSEDSGGRGAAWGGKGGRCVVCVSRQVGKSASPIQSPTLQGMGFEVPSENANMGCRQIRL